MDIYRSLIRPALFLLPPETAHELAMTALRVLPYSAIRLLAGSAPSRPVTVFNIEFPNPIGLAAGFDKSAVALPAWEALGFGFVEAGTVTARPQPGNPKPRVFRLKSQEALINRFGFNNDGADAVATRLAHLKNSGKWPRIPVGINIGKSKVTPLEDAAADYAYSFHRLAPFADYVALNVSSPNTPGLRQLQGRDALDALLARIQSQNDRRIPVLLKIAPDLTWPQVDEIIALAESRGLAGLIATNTTIDHTSVPEPLRQNGGLSGRPLAARSTEVIAHIAKHSKLPVIGVGGIASARDAREKLDAGAALLQLYTAFIYRGPRIATELAAGLR